MTLILSGTNGLSDVDGTAATPAIRGTDANTGIFFPAADTIAFSEGGVEAMRLDSSGNLGLGVTPSAWGAAWKANQYVGGSIASPNGNNNLILQNAYNDGTNYRYIITGAASYYQQSAGQHIWLNAPSGTAGNAISFTQAMTLDASANLAVGLTPTNGYGKLQLVASGTVLPTGDSNVPAGYSYAQFSGSSGAVSDWLLLRGPYGNAGHKTGILLQDTFYDNNAYAGRYIQAAGGALTFGQMLNGTIYSSNGTLTEHARIDTSGNLLVGTTSQFLFGARQAIAYVGGAAGAVGLSFKPTSDDGYPVYFFNAANAGVGSIRTSSTTTTYNTTSDYRLKTVIGPVADAGARIDALQPVEYEWKADGLRTRGFLAHQFQEVYAASVTGSKDEVDKNGKPVYQAMQAGSSEVIADLVAELKSLRARVAQLEAK